ncbi:MAG: lipoyl(octanoyl) transferase LipB [Bdellovibrionales bacterium]
MSISLSGRYFGLCEYSQALDLQQQYVEIAREGPQAFLIGFEHPSVVTLGIRATTNDLKISEEELQSKEVALARIDRGGEATLHSPGQLVIYPILPLQRLGLNVREFVEKLEMTAISFFGSFGVTTTKGVGAPGIYSMKGKMGFIGIRVKNGVSYHGISLNICNDLSLFQMIRSCGKEKENFDQLSQYGVNASQMQLFEIFKEHFQFHFKEFFVSEASLLTEASRQV